MIYSMQAASCVEARYAGGRLRSKTDSSDSIIIHATFNGIGHVSKMLHPNFKR